MKDYIRDKRSPKPKDSNVSKIMSANKAKSTKPELLLRKALFNVGLRGYRLNYIGVPGKPDIAFVSKRLAVFVHGCYWHRCPHCNLNIPKHNTEFWRLKFERNIERDNRKMEELKSLGWNTLTIWECELREIRTVILRVESMLKSKEK